MYLSKWVHFSVEVGALQLQDALGSYCGPCLNFLCCAAYLPRPAPPTPAHTRTQQLHNIIFWKTMMTTMARTTGLAPRPRKLPAKELSFTVFPSEFCRLKSGACTTNQAILGRHARLPEPAYLVVVRAS